MRSSWSWLNRKITTKQSDSRFAELFCYAGSLVVLIAGIHKIERLVGSEKEYLLGLGVLFPVVGMLVAGGVLARFLRRLESAPPVSAASDR